MSLTVNSTRHWQLPDGFELLSGDRVEFYENGEWFPGRIEYRPRIEYVLVLDRGELVELSTDLVLRVRSSSWVPAPGNTLPTI